MTRREEALHLVVQAARVIGMQGSDRRDRARLRDALETLDAIDAASAPAPVEARPDADEIARLREGLGFITHAKTAGEARGVAAALLLAAPVESAPGAERPVVGCLECHRRVGHTFECSHNTMPESMRSGLRAPASPPAAEPGTADDFHGHLDACERCRTRPFDLCSIGATLLRAAGGTGRRDTT